MQNKYSMPFCGLQLKLYETGKTAPSFEYQAPSTKAKFQCSLTKKLYGLSEVMNWYKTPEVQAYARAGYMLKWGSRVQDAKEEKYGQRTEQIICLYMIKPYKSGAIDGMKKIQVPPVQAQPTPQPQAIQTQQIKVEENQEEFDDEIPF
tara:strand:+ start:260 stop:703 length:444 start_codon:yes stop_codon:yes gene_type:complete